MLRFLRRPLELFRRPRIIVQQNGSLEQIRDAEYPLVMVPFHGTMVPVVLRKLTQSQIRACGDFSLIQTFEDKVRAKSSNLTMGEINAYAKRYHRIAEAALVEPTYDEILGIFSADSVVLAARVKLDELGSMLEETPRGPKRAALEEEIESMRIWCDLVLPIDFLSAIMSYALDIEASDIGEVTTEVMLDIAILAERGSDNPADHLDGRFTPFMKDDINRRAWTVYGQWREKNTPPEQRARRRKVIGGR